MAAVGLRTFFFYFILCAANWSTLKEKIRRGATMEPPRLQVLQVCFCSCYKSRNPGNSISEAHPTHGIHSNTPACPCPRFSATRHLNEYLCPIHFYFYSFGPPQILFEATVKGISQRVLGSASYQVGKLDVLNVSASPCACAGSCSGASSKWCTCMCSLPRERLPCSSSSCSWTTACSWPTLRTRGLLNFKVRPVLGSQAESEFTHCLEQSRNASCDPTMHQQYVGWTTDCILKNNIVN